MTPATKPVVVLLHGLARGPGSMAKLGRAFAARGYPVWAPSYPSRRATIAEAAAQVSDELAAAHPGRPLWAVTHSMGGILLRHMHAPELAWQRAVMLAPPNAGSHLAATLRDVRMFRWFYGPAGIELGGGAAWPAPPAPFLVIAGTRSFALTNFTSWTVARAFAPGVANDGTVTVDETRHPAMAAFATVDATHTWIMNDPGVQARCFAFLESDLQAPASAP